MQVKRFDPTKINQKSVIIVSGKRNRGKSTLIVDLARHFKCPRALVLSLTDSCANFYAPQYFPRRFVLDKFDESTLRRLIDLQKRAVKKHGLDFAETGTLLIIDDTGAKKSFLRSKELNEIVYNGRWLNITTILGLQDPVDSLMPALRGQVDYFFGLQESFKKQKERLHNYFFGMFSKYKDFDSVYSQVTANFGVCVLDNTSKDMTRPQNCIRWYRARYPLVKYQFGSRAYWGNKKTKTKKKSQQPYKTSSGILIRPLPRPNPFS